MNIALALPVQNLAGDLIVAVCENVTLDIHGFADNALDGKSATIDFGRNPRNRNAPSAVGWYFELGACALASR